MDPVLVKRHLAAVIADLDAGRPPRRPAFAISVAVAAVGLGLAGCGHDVPLYGAVMDLEQDCDDGVDDDGDGLTDCDDDDCADSCDTQTLYGAPPEELCDNLLDDDGDGLTDCDDDDCAEDPACLNVGAYGAPME